MSAKCIMVLGTSSGAGKSWVATALCRIYAQLGYQVSPFKAQNMSNNARVVTVDGVQGEIGSAQYFQALAAKKEPLVQMNPVLLKPEADTKSQVVLLGKVNSELASVPWRDRSEYVWPEITKSLDYLIANNEIVIIEGAGSPAEINLMSSDIVNLRIAEYANAQCLLVSDIDRGGAFAHLYGTWSLIGPHYRTFISGFILNKFRGDKNLLAPGPEILEELTGVPVVAIVPMLHSHGLPEEDGIFNEGKVRPDNPSRTIAIIVYPHISNHDEFEALKNITGLQLVWAHSPRDILGVDWIILPGSKQTSSDLKWLRLQGFEILIRQHALEGKPILGICGGLQMLGMVLDDPHGVDDSAIGLGLLTIKTTFEPEKILKKTAVEFPLFKGCWSGLAGLKISGYEIHHGQTTAFTLGADESESTELISGMAWINPQKNILSLYLHGIFENSEVLQAFFGEDVNSLETVFDQLAMHVKNSACTGEDFFVDLIEKADE